MAQEKAVKYEAPAGFSEQSDDCVGFYNGEGLIKFVPLHAKLSDGKKFDRKKSSTLIIARLVEPCELNVKEDGEDSVIDGQEGDIIGIWAKPGMRALANLADVEVHMYQEGERDVGKGNPMKLYKIFSAKKGNKLRVTSDNRDKSRSEPHFLLDGAASTGGDF